MVGSFWGSDRAVVFVGSRFMLLNFMWRSLKWDCSCWCLFRAVLIFVWCSWISVIICAASRFICSACEIIPLILNWFIFACHSLWE